MKDGDDSSVGAAIATTATLAGAVSMCAAAGFTIVSCVDGNGLALVAKNFSAALLVSTMLSRNASCCIASSVLS